MQPATSKGCIEKKASNVQKSKEKSEEKKKTASKKLVIILQQCSVDKKVLRTYFDIAFYNRIAEIEKKLLERVSAFVVKIIPTGEELAKCIQLERVVQVSESLEVQDIGLVTIAGIEIVNSLPGDLRMLNYHLINHLMGNLPLVAVINRSDCSVEVSTLSNIARLAIFETQRTMHETVLNKAVGLIMSGTVTLSRNLIERFKCLRVVCKNSSSVIDIQAAGAHGIAVCEVLSGDDRLLAAEEMKTAICSRTPYKLQHCINYQSFTLHKTTPFWHQTKFIPRYSSTIPGMFEKYIPIAQPLFEGLNYDEFGTVKLTAEQQTALNTITRSSRRFVQFIINPAPHEPHSFSSTHVPIDGNMYFPESFEMSSFAVCDRCGLWAVGYILTHLLIVYHIRMKHNLLPNKLDIVKLQCSQVNNGRRCEKEFFLVKERGPSPALHCWDCELFNDVNPRYFTHVAHDKPNNYLEEFENKYVTVMKTAAGITIAYSTSWKKTLG